MNIYRSRLMEGKAIGYAVFIEKQSASVVSEGETWNYALNDVETLPLVFESIQRAKVYASDCKKHYSKEYRIVIAEVGYFKDASLYTMPTAHPDKANRDIVIVDLAGDREYCKINDCRGWFKRRLEEYIVN